MRKISRLLLVLFILGLFTGALAADQTPAPLTESVAVQIALAHSPMLRMAQAEAGMTQAQVGMAKSEGKLQVSGNALAAASNMRNVLPISGVMPQALLQSQDKASLDFNGTAMVPLSTGGRISNTVKAAQLTADAAKTGIATSRAQVAFEARTMYAQWRQALAMETVAGDALAAQMENAKVTQQLFDVGKVPMFDVLRARAAQAAAQQQVANAHADVVAMQANLAQVLGVPAESLGPAADEEAATPPADALQTALARRPELQAAQQTIKAAEATVKARQAAYRPQIYAFGMADVLAPADMGKSAGYSIGVGAGLPILDGGRRKAEVEEAKQGVAQAQAARDSVELQVRAEVAGAQARVTAAQQNIDTAAAQVKSADEAYTVAQARYGAGKSNIVELLDARQALTEAQQSLVTAQAQYRATLAALYRAIGWDVAPAPPVAAPMAANK